MAKLSNSSSTTTQRKSYLLSVTPVEYSLTEGTNIPAPEHSPTRPDPADIAPPPTPGRGPLNSHPTTPPAGASETELDRQQTREISRGNGVHTDRGMSSDSADGFRKPSSPASAAQNSSSSPQPRRPSGVKKLLSLSNLRSSFSSSRTSLAVPRSSNDTYHSTQNTSTYNPSLKRPSSPSMASTTASSYNQQPQSQNHPPLRSKKSGGNWFKRKSGLFMLNGNGELDSVAEDNSYRPDTRESKRVKPSSSASGGGRETVINRVPAASAPERKTSPPPLIPEIGRGGGFSGGDLGWDEASFRR